MLSNEQISKRIEVIFITLKRRVLYAGEIVEGCIQVQCYESIKPRYLMLRLSSKEQVQGAFQDKSGKGGIFQQSKNERVTYKQSMILRQFQHNIHKGQYSFPFYILLPANLPASMTINSKNYIKNLLFCYFSNTDQNVQGKIDYKICRRKLYIRQPLRNLQNNPVKDRKMTIGEVSCFCTAKRSGQLSLQMQNPEIKRQEPSEITVKVDNHQGILFKNIKIELVEILTKIAQVNKIQTSAKQQSSYPIYSFQKEIPVGSVFEQKVQLKFTNIPVNFYTAIGSIISQEYYLRLVGQLGGCYKNISISKHVILNNKWIPPLQNDQVQNPPAVWNPVAYKPIPIINLSPYVYEPSPLITFINQKAPKKLNRMPQASSRMPQSHIKMIQKPHRMSQEPNKMPQQANKQSMHELIVNKQLE